MENPDAITSQQNWAETPKIWPCCPCNKDQILLRYYCNDIHGPHGNCHAFLLKCYDLQHLRESVYSPGGWWLGTWRTYTSGWAMGCGEPILLVMPGAYIPTLFAPPPWDKLCRHSQIFVRQCHYLYNLVHTCHSAQNDTFELNASQCILAMLLLFEFEIAESSSHRCPT